MAGLRDLRFYNLGMKNTTINTQGESYRVLTGPRAELAVTRGDGRAYVQGHFFCSGEEGTQRETIGASSSSRIWSNQHLTVAGYLCWISMLNARLSGSAAVAATQFDLVQSSQSLKRLPDRVIGGVWNKVAYRDAPAVRLRKQPAEWTYGQITDFELQSFLVKEEGKVLDFSIYNDDFSILFRFSLSDGPLFRQEDANWQFEVRYGQDDWLDIAQWLSLHPASFFGADKSSFEGVNGMPAPSTTISALADRDIEILDWSGCEIRAEFDEVKAKGSRTVHQHLELFLRSRSDLEVLVYDHRSGEAADFIALTTGGDGAVSVSLYHCKGAGGEPSGDRVNDVYEVACQLLKSVVFCNASILSEHVVRRINPRHKHPSRFIVGDLKRLQQLLLDTQSHSIKFHIYGVQPGVSKLLIDDHLADLMAFGLDYVQNGGTARGVWLISP